jgi:hypothetical protein
MINKIVGTRHTPLRRGIQFEQASLRRGMQFGQTPLRNGMQFGFFFFYM